MVLTMMSVGAMAQTDTITSRTHQLDEVTITETQRKHTVTSTAPLHLLDRKDMLTMGVTDIADALHRLPGITLRDYGGAGGMKTVSVRGFGAKHTGVSYDGVMLSECQSGEIDLSRYSLDNVGNLSLTIGDNDDIFIPARQASVPAVLHIQTLALPTEDTRPHLTTQVKFGSFGYVSPFIRYEQNLSDKFAFSAVGEYTYAENDYPYELKNGLETIQSERNNNKMNSGHGELNFLWTINPTNRLSGKVYYYDNDRQLPGIVHYYVNLNKETLRDRNVFSQLMYQTRWGDRVSLKWNAKFNWFSSSYRDPLYEGNINDADYWQREAYTAAAVLYTPNRYWAFDYSADYAFNNLNGSSKRTVVGRPYRHTILQSATAKYRDNRLTMIARLLYSLYLNDSKEGPKSRNMRRLSPSLSVSYKLLEEHDIYVRASYKNIFRAPTFNENYYYHYGSTNLKPESTNQYNLGITYADDLSEKTTFQFTLDGYYNQVTDKIVTLPVNMFIWRCVNVGEVKIIGVDCTMRAARRFTSEHIVSMTGSYSYQSAKDKTLPGSSSYDNQLAYTPLHTVSGSVGYENPWVNLSLHLTGMSDRWANNEHYEDTDIDGYVEFGLTAWRQFRFGRHQLEGRIDLKNLLNTQYELVRYYPMPRRSYQVTLNYKF
ncbi:MAG: TonB-dependent receptor [Prevotella sp.]|nr:TonB-dependent receptor [Prevotella sp.]